MKKCISGYWGRENIVVLGAGTGQIQFFGTFWFVSPSLAGAWNLHPQTHVPYFSMKIYYALLARALQLGGINYWGARAEKTQFFLWKINLRNELVSPPPSTLCTPVTESVSFNSRSLCRYGTCIWGRGHNGKDPKFHRNDITTSFSKNRFITSF